MTLAFSGRVEGQYVVPSGTTLSVSSGALTSAVSVTWPAGTYFDTAAGTVSSGLTTLQSAINAAVSPYPDNATSMAAAVGYGTWSAGWSWQIASGNDTGLFGGVTMTAVSSPTYRTAGPANGTDYAVGFDSASDAFNAGDTFDVTNTSDFCIAWAAKFSAAPGSTKTFITKRTTGAGWQILANADGTYTFRGFDATPTQLFSCTGASMHAGSWHVGIATIDRATGKARIGTYSLAGSSSVSTEQTTAATTMANAVAFTVGDDASAAGGGVTTALLSALYIGAGTSIATGLSANLSTALVNLAAAVNSAFAVSTSTSTGLTTISNSFWPCAVSFTSTNARDKLGYEYSVDYPQTAAQMTTALGYGTWGGGWLCNESSGTLGSIFGPATFSANGTPTYSNLGARGGSDKAIGIDAGTDYFTVNTSAAWDVAALDDLIVAWVMWNPTNFTSGTNRIVIKNSGATYYAIDSNGGSGGTASFAVYDGVDSTQASTASGGAHVGEWHVGIAVLDRATNKLRIGTCGLRSGVSYVSSEVDASAIGSLSNAAVLTIGGQAGQPWLLSSFYIGSGSSVATGLSSNLSTALSNFAAYMKSQTSTAQAKGIWFPDCPISLDGDPSQAPRVTDKRTTVSPTGQAFSLVGNSYRRHRGVTWSHVPRAQVWESAATYTNGSFETFANDCLYGLGHAWFTPSSPVQIYWSDAGTDRALGYTYNSSVGVDGWYVLNVDSTEPRPSVDGWTGLFRVEFGDVVAVES